MDSCSIICRNGFLGSIPDRSKYNQFLAEDMGEVLREFDDRIAAMEMDIHRHQEIVQKSQHDMQSGSQKIREIENSLRETTESLRVLHNKRRGLEEKREECLKEAQVDTLPLEEEREQRKEAIASMTQEYERLAKELEVLKVEVQEAGHQKSVIEKRKSQIKGQMDELERKISSTLGQQDAARKTVENYQRQFAKKEKALEEAKAGLAAKMKLREEKENHARTQTASLLENWNQEPLVVEENETKDHLRAVIVSKQKLLEEGKGKAGLQGQSKEELMKRILAATEAFKEEKSKFDALMTTLANLESDHKDRRMAWKDLYRKNKKIVSRMFDKYLQKKGFSGELQFNDKEFTLNICCQTDNKDERTQCNDVRQLSGGERSYTTLCLLMALGHVVSPYVSYIHQFKVTYRLNLHSVSWTSTTYSSTK